MISAGQERSEVMHRLSRAVELLAGAMDVRLLPESGGNIAFAVRNARDGRDVQQSGVGSLPVTENSFCPARVNSIPARISRASYSPS